MSTLIEDARDLVRFWERPEADNPARAKASAEPNCWARATDL